MSNLNNATQLHLMNPLTRFTDRASDYAKYRPSYPHEAIEVILQGLSSPIVAADIGAGTGISSRLLAQQGVKVIAIEPNAAMRQAAESHQLVEFRDGTAEATCLPNNSVNLVTCFQSFHWFNPETTLEEFHRILKPLGRLALVWNERDRQDAFTAEYIQLISEVSNHHPIESSRLKSVEPLFATPYFVNIQKHEFAYKQALDLSGLIGCASSVSYVSREESAQQYLITKLQELYNRSCDKQGLIYIVYRTSIYLAEPQIN
ncbi:class I SAM-dependent methyltransferase [Gloeocapsopsis crepidinum LEGE 06123]|uniref:Class I SAM-dependent methyltransferase n=1 Tax=Gloeocapsopsis crepidinum LEGE 06123 TaxID=588587 RepID=A0ABR9UYN2_9CHRO|nr:class I SAM-dependent methyltransferase [Gloeocapsopsis crepidinum]MBE9193422.1 class I SAM-dependent methyltransferase [Gloeocapsopsis crepidinum LEGE 06123]